MADTELGSYLTGILQTGSKIKLARGVVGKSAYVTTAALIVLGIIACRIGPELLIWVLLALLAMYFCWQFGVMWYANRNPGPALLEGGELVAWQRMAIKGAETPQDGPSIPDPMQKPALPSPEEEGKPDVEVS
jgi:hypothetical protein